MDLKRYQKRVINSLSSYLKNVRLKGANEAFVEQVERPYFAIPQLPHLPYVCLRVPTGGGKTLLASRSIEIIMKDLLNIENSVVLWLVPSTQIKEQTLKALRDVNHPYRKALEDSAGRSISVVDTTEALFLNKSMVENETLIIVSTLAAMRIEDTDGRKIYDDNGYLKVFFEDLSEEVLSKLERTDGDSRISYSLANVLKTRRPIVLIDEAHNARTQLSFDTLSRFNPSCIVEFTATPRTTHNPDKGEYASNVLFSVSASELFAEKMIKLPVRLETSSDWRDVVANALARRKKLHILANQERRHSGEYIRPIVLLQAQPKSKNKKTINIDVLHQTLIEDFKIPAEEIAFSTGDRKELVGVNLFAEDCKIKYIITVNALREGWDCSFAYVLCSVAELSSATAVEQLVGRILRLPNAEKKRIPDLNKAYAYISSAKFNDTLQSLTDALVDNGFEKFEAKNYIDTTSSELNLFNQDFFVSEERVEEVPDFESLSGELSQKITFSQKDSTILFTGVMTEKDKKEIKLCFKTDDGKKAVEDLFTQTLEILEIIGESEVEQEEDKVFKVKPDFKVPYLAYYQQDLFSIFEESLYLGRSWDITTYDVELTEEDFSPKAGVTKSRIGEVSISERGKLESKFISDATEQLTLNINVADWSIVDITSWIDRKIQHPDISINQSTLFIHNVINNLLDVREYKLQELVFYKYKLRNAIEKLIDKHRKQARKVAYQTFLDLGGEQLLTSDEFTFEFNKDIYPANWFYSGRIKFNKHFHGNDMVGELKDSGEEFDCALVIDQLNEVKHWVRNIDSNPEFSFWLQRPKNRFYPDFVAELNDGRILVVEYKGDHIKDGESEKEKKAVGELWASRSNGKCLFYWATKDNVDRLSDFINQSNN